MWAYKALLNMGLMPENEMHQNLKSWLGQKQTAVLAADIFEFAKTIVPEEDYESVLYTMQFIARLN